MSTVNRLWFARPFWSESKSGDDAGDAEDGREGAGDLEFPATQREGLEDVGESLKKAAWKNLMCCGWRT